MLLQMVILLLTDSWLHITIEHGQKHLWSITDINPVCTGTRSVLLLHKLLSVLWYQTFQKKVGRKIRLQRNTKRLFIPYIKSSVENADMFPLLHPCSHDFLFTGMCLYVLLSGTTGIWTNMMFILFYDTEGNGRKDKLKLLPVLAV